MAAKSTNVKSSKVKKNDDVVPESLEDEEALPITPKIKNPIEIEEPEEEAPLIPLEDKADPLVQDEEDEFAGDELGLDDESIDPFGDKWES